MENSVCEQRIFDQLFMDHSKGLRNYLVYKSGNVQLAEDLVQEAFIKLWQNCSNVIIDKAKSFLFSVANNLFINEVKHRQVVFRFEQIERPKVENENPQHILEQKEFKIKLENAIAALPEGQREVFLLNRIEKKSYKEIAEMLGVSVKAIEKRMHKALVKLRGIIKNK